MQRQASLIVSIVQSGGKLPQFIRTIHWHEPRIRILDANGRAQLDSGPLQDTDTDEESGAQHNWLYRVGAALLKKPMQWLRPTTRPLPSTEAYERSPILRGREVQDALLGRNGV